TYDITVLLILFICVLIRLPIAKSMSKTVVITISLGLAVVTILSYLKTKSDYLKKEIKSSDEIND
ncbi:MAG: hypothetical protein RR645_02240, partial [Clostridium sp.]